MSTLTNVPSRVAQATNSATGSVGSAALSHQAGAKAHNAVEYLSEGAHRMVESLESRAATIEPKGRRVLAGAQSYVRANPLLSLGMAVVAGMVVRHLVRR
jgi:ElaB/YqjD/DUF883 family membrane-anchored ribosome-binding protein